MDHLQEAKEWLEAAQEQKPVIRARVETYALIALSHALVALVEQSEQCAKASQTISETLKEMSND